MVGDLCGEEQEQEEKRRRLLIGHCHPAFLFFFPFFPFFCFLFPFFLSIPFFSFCSLFFFFSVPCFSFCSLFFLSVPFFVFCFLFFCASCVLACSLALRCHLLAGPVVCFWGFGFFVEILEDTRHKTTRYHIILIMYVRLIFFFLDPQERLI